MVGCRIPDCVVMPEFNTLNPDMKDPRYSTGTLRLYPRDPQPSDVFEQISEYTRPVAGWTIWSSLMDTTNTFTRCL